MKRLNALILIFFSLFGCDTKKTLPPPSRTIHLNFSYSPFSTDPRKSTDPVTSAHSFMLYEGLMHLDQEGHLILALAEDVHVSKDQQCYHFKLRSANWSDGSAVTAWDFEAAWKEALDPNFSSRAAHLLYALKNGEAARAGQCSIHEVGVKALDEKNLEVVLEKPCPYFLQLTAYPTYFPVPAHPLAHPLDENTLITNGPFVLKSWKQDNEILLEKNPHYRQAKNVAIDRVAIALVSDERTALTLFEKGELDFVGGLISPLPLDAISALKNSGLLCHQPIAGTTFCTFNTHTSLFSNLNIRKAFAHAIDREAIVHNVIQIASGSGKEIIPPILKNQSPTSTRTLEVNEGAAPLFLEMGLKELGIEKTGLPPLTYNYFSSELQRKLALVLQNEWQRTLGVEVCLEGAEINTFFEKLRGKQFQFAQVPWLAHYVDPTSYLERLKKGDALMNISGWENSEYAQLLNNACWLNTNDRLNALEQAENILIEEVPTTPLYHFPFIYLKNPQLKQLHISPLGELYLHHAYFEESLPKKP